METRKTMAELEIEYLNKAKDLSEYFQIKRPRIRVLPKKCGTYYPHLETIKIPYREGREPKRTETTFIHEFAHHLNSKRGGKHHDAGFKRSLWSVAKRYYGDPLKYNWASDYKNVTKYFERRIKGVN